MLTVAELDMDLAEIMKLGKSLGYSSEDIDRLIEREDRKEKEKYDREQRMAEREQRRLELDLQEKEKDRQHELALAQLKVDTSRNGRGEGESENESVSRSAIPKIPPFDDANDDMDSYLQRFEKLAVFYKWKESDYAYLLGTLLRGRALDLYVKLSPEVANDYTRLKDSLLKEYVINADMYRKKFNSSVVGAGESYVSFVSRLEHYLNRWLNLSDVADFQELCDLLVRDQLLNSSPPEMRTFLKEREFSKALDMAVCADRYINAHDCKNKSKTGNGKQKQSYQNVKYESNIPKCHQCGKLGHIRPDCFHNPKNFKSSGKGKADTKVQYVFNRELRPEDCLIDPNGSAFGNTVEVTFDSGCSTVVLSEKIVPSEYKKGKLYKLYDYLGIPSYFPKVRCFLSCKFFKGWVSAYVAPIKFAEVLLGRIPGVSVPNIKINDRGESSVDNEGVVNEQNKMVECSLAVQTRAGRARETVPLKPLVCPNLDLGIDKNILMQEQEKCPTLASIRKKIGNKEIVQLKIRKIRYNKIDGLIYRICEDSQNRYEIGKKQLVVPKLYTRQILELAHESIFSGHFSHRKTSDKLFQKFFWPGASSDVVRFCKSCVVCQKHGAKGNVMKVPLKSMPVISEPFSRIAIDLIGPISPVSQQGNRYILTIIDYATRFPEAVALKNIDTITIAESLVEVFSRVGIPREILSDRGSQFKSDLMSEINRLMSIKALFTSPYHAACNGAVERLNGVLKSMLKKLCVDHPSDWDRYIPSVLFAYREIPNDTLKYSPFELLYGRSIRGPLSILYELWTKENMNPELKTTYQYVFDLRNRLEETSKLAVQNAEISSGQYKKYYDLKTKNRSFKVGEEVLLLLPTSSNKFSMQWRGPYKVEQCHDNGVDYVIKVKGKSKLFHVNMLKKFYRRENEMEGSGMVQFCMVDEEEESDVCDISFYSYNKSEVNINPDLDVRMKGEMNDLVKKFSDVFCDVPGKTKTLEHMINLTTDIPVRKKPYQIPHHLIDEFDKEVDSMLKLGIIEPSTSPYCSPVVFVRKHDNSWRLCIDFRALNDITVFDSEPMPSRDEALKNFVGDRYFSEIDLCKGYFQLPLSPDSKIYTAFATNKGLMQFTMMPFGLKTAPASFIRLMRKVVSGLDNTDCYFDNLVVHNSNWSAHIRSLRMLLSRLRKHGLTAGPKKCFLGYPQIKYLGYVLGNDSLHPVDEKIVSVCKMPLPQTKKQLRSFMGTVGFYRKFIENFAGISAPITNLLKKHRSNNLKWSDEQINCFELLKEKLISKPILILPDFSKAFYLRTDASNNAIGAVLLQDCEDVKKPVSYAGKKLLPREQNFATVEKECYAIVWAVNKFREYLLGKEFVLQTDHQPLVYLNKFKNLNGRLMRWSLALQNFSFAVEYIKGSENVGADMLSRCI